MKTSFPWNILIVADSSSAHDPSLTLKILLDFVAAGLFKRELIIFLLDGDNFSVGFMIFTAKLLISNFFSLIMDSLAMTCCRHQTPKVVQQIPQNADNFKSTFQKYINKDWGLAGEVKSERIPIKVLITTFSDLDLLLVDLPRYSTRLIQSRTSDECRRIFQIFS